MGGQGSSQWIFMSSIIRRGHELCRQLPLHSRDEPAVSRRNVCPQEYEQDSDD
jgi:hypothetical protein